MLQLERVSKVYRVEGLEVRAVEEVDFKAAQGEYVAVNGESGSGKSTLLMMSGGLARPSQGRVLLDGKDIYALPAADRRRVRADRVGFVFQTFQLVPYLTTLENITLPVLAAGGAGGDLRNRAGMLMEKLGLAHRAAHRPSELSAGERQRVALARALLRSPDILLADEPTGNLDDENAAAVMGHLAEFNRAGGTVVLVTHDARLAGSAGRVVRMVKGRVAGS